EDHRLSIVQDLVDGIGRSMARAVDLIGIHGINPLTGTSAASVQTYLNQTTNRVEATASANADFEAAVHQVVGASAAGSRSLYLPTGAGLDPRFAFALATERNEQTGVKLNPDMGYGFNAGNLNGLKLASSTAI